MLRTQNLPPWIGNFFSCLKLGNFVHHIFQMWFLSGATGNLLRSWLCCHSVFLFLKGPIDTGYNPKTTRASVSLGFVSIGYKKGHSIQQSDQSLERWHLVDTSTNLMAYTPVPETSHLLELSSSSSDEVSHINRINLSFPEVCLEYCIVVITFGCFLVISSSVKFLSRGSDCLWMWWVYRRTES